MEALFDFLGEVLGGLFEGALDALFDRPRKDKAQGASGDPPPSG